LPSAPPSPAVRDPYDPPPPPWGPRPDLVAAAAVFVLTVALTVGAFPPFKAPEFAYVLAAPALLWACRRPQLKLFLWTLFAAQAVSWTILLSWLHHVTWGGLLFLGPFIGAWVGSWYLAAWWTMPRIIGRPTLVRVGAQLGLAGAWVVIEWTRNWLLGGFPWLPLAASQWQRMSVIQVASFTGAGGISFVLIMMNIGASAYAHRLFFEGQQGFRRRSQEFLLALFLLLACLCLMVSETINRAQFSVPLGRIALVQPEIPQSEKWDPAEQPKDWVILQRLTLFAAAGRPDLILWPEASAPGWVKGDPQFQAQLEALVAHGHVPVLLGGVGAENPGTPTEKDFNGAFVATPDLGLQTAYYAKRHLVPFGEYVPFRSLFPKLAKIVPIGGDFQAGTDAAPLLIHLPYGTIAFGVLICYEDIFPSLARDTTLAGADVLTVLSNDAWYGEGAESRQHAAESVLRAVETRRPVLRCTNGGWSGWIDEFGAIRQTLADENGREFFRGAESIDVTRDSRWVNQQSFYVQHGDWFVLVGAILVGLGATLLLTAPARPPEPPAA
jgi:apolipoprotein N-acyltransferase